MRWSAGASGELGEAEGARPPSPRRAAVGGQAVRRGRSQEAAVWGECTVARTVPPRAVQAAAKPPAGAREAGSRLRPMTTVSIRALGRLHRPYQGCEFGFLCARRVAAGPGGAASSAATDRGANGGPPVPRGCRSDWLVPLFSCRLSIGRTRRAGTPRTAGSPAAIAVASSAKNTRCGDIVPAGDGPQRGGAVQAPVKAPAPVSAERARRAAAIRLSVRAAECSPLRHAGRVGLTPRRGRRGRACAGGPSGRC